MSLCLLTICVRPLPSPSQHQQQHSDLALLALLLLLLTSHLNLVLRLWLKSITVLGVLSLQVRGEGATVKIPPATSH